MRRRYWLVLLDSLFIALSSFGAFLLRFEGHIPPSYLRMFTTFLIPIIITRLVIFYFFGLYRALLEYASIDELLSILKAVTLSSILIATFLLLERIGYPRSVIFLDWLLALFFIGGSRVVWRLIREKILTKIKGVRSYRRVKRVLIVGAGDAGESLLREILKFPHLHYRPIGFIDDNPQKLGLRIHGVPILGNRKDIPWVIKEKEIDEVLLAIPSAPGSVTREIIEEVKKSGSGVSVKTLPSIYELIDGRVSVNQIREVMVEDLLRREPAEINTEEIRSYLFKKRILITGAGGSIGSELSRQVSRFSPKLLILLGQGENSIYEIDREIGEWMPKSSFISIIADVKDKERMEMVFSQYRPEVIFHTAAYKHVPLMEFNVSSAIMNNILGTQVLIELAKRYHTDRFVFISTDKAVEPISVMGATKRIAELLLQLEASVNSHPKFTIVRFGNVLDSRGSVVPLFKYQIAQGGPVTITHPEAERFFMTIPEAVQLVIQAGGMGNGGEVFVLDMGEPIKIVDLARDLIRLLGFEPDKEIPIKFIGLRPGEKLKEKLIADTETVEPTQYKKIWKVIPHNSLDRRKFLKGIKELSDLTAHNDKDKLIEKMKELLSEYHPA